MPTVDLSTVVKATCFFELGDAGWSDSFYITDSVSLHHAAPVAAQIASVLHSCHALNVKFIGVRLSRPTVFRDSRFYPNGSDPIGSPSPTSLVNAAPASTALILRMEAGEFSRREFELRGVPASIIGPNGTYVPSGNWQGIMNYLCAFLSGFPVGGMPSVPFYLWTLQNSTALVPWQQISVLQPSLTGYGLQVTVPNPITNGAVQLDAGKVVQVATCRRTRNVNGYWVIRQVIAPPVPDLHPWIYYLKDKGRPVAIPADENPGRVRAYDRVVQLVDKVVVERLDTRKVGRPFGQPVGRRRITS